MKERLRILVKWLMFWLLSAGSTRRYFALRGSVTLAASRLSLYERRHMRFLSHVLHAGDTTIDAGANFGAYAQEMSRLVGRRGRVVCFEPIPDVHAVLEHHMSKRGNVVCHQVALSDIDRRGVELRIPILWQSLPEPALASLEPVSVPHTVSRVDVIRLDSLADDLRNCRFIKVDIEGHEQAFLRGAMQVITRDRPLIQIESTNISRDGATYRRFADAAGYDLRYLDDDEQLKSLRPGVATGQYNFYLVPREWSEDGRTLEV